MADFTTDFKAPESAKLNLLGGFELRYDQHYRPDALPLSAQRVIAFLAVHRVPIVRSYVAESLWPDSHRRQAAANLRSAIWRIRKASTELVVTVNSRLALGSWITVDFQDATALAHRLLDRSASLAYCDVSLEAVATLSLELLPDWLDEWVLIRRDRWDQLRLHALEALAERLLQAGELSQAVQAALAAVGVEPLRESAHRILIRVYAAEGNSSEAVSQYMRFRGLLRRELSIPPTAQMEELIRGLTSR